MPLAGPGGAWPICFDFGFMLLFTFFFTAFNYGYLNAFMKYEDVVVQPRSDLCDVQMDRLEPSAQPVMLKLGICSCDKYIIS